MELNSCLARGPPSKKRKKCFSGCQWMAALHYGSICFSALAHSPVCYSVIEPALPVIRLCPSYCLPESKFHPSSVLAPAPIFHYMPRLLQRKVPLHEKVILLMTHEEVPFFFPSLLTVATSVPVQSPISAAYHFTAYRKHAEVYISRRKR